MKMPLLVTVAVIGLAVGFASVAYAQAPGGGMRTESFIIGGLTILGVLVVVLLAMTARIQTLIDKRVDTRMSDDGSVFGRHRLDALAHEPMRVQLLKELHLDFERLRHELAVTEKHHHDDIANLTSVMKPLIENSSKAMDAQSAAMDMMATQIRRRQQTSDARDGSEERRGGE